MITEPNLLYSFINTKLRDEYGSLDELCSSLDYDKGEIERILGDAGWHYSEAQNRFC